MNKMGIRRAQLPYGVHIQNMPNGFARLIFYVGDNHELTLFVEILDKDRGQIFREDVICSQHKEILDLYNFDRMRCDEQEIASFIEFTAYSIEVLEQPMNKKQYISREQWIQIAHNMLPNGHHIIWDKYGSAFTDLFLYRDEHQCLKLCVSSSVMLATYDETFHEEIINLDEHPELLAIYDMEKQEIVECEAFNFVDGHLLNEPIVEFDWQLSEAGSVSESPNQPPTATFSTH